MTAQLSERLSGVQIRTSGRRYEAITPRGLSQTLSSLGPWNLLHSIAPRSESYLHVELSPRHSGGIFIVHSGIGEVLRDQQSA